MPDPLPDLRARNFRGGCVFHQIEDRHSATAAQPRFKILDADTDVGAQASLGDRFARSEIEQVFAR